MRTIILTFALLAIFGACTNNSTIKSAEIKSDSSQVVDAYQCSMDCEKGKTYDKAGICPVCGMELDIKN